MKSKFSSFIFVPQHHNMKYILTILLCAIFVQQAVAGNREPSLVKGDISATLAVGTFFYPLLNESYVQLGPYSVAVDYQLSKRFSVSGLAYYVYSASQMAPRFLVLDTGGGSSWRKWDYAATQVMFGGFLSGHYWYMNRSRVSLSCGLGLGIYNNVVKYDFADYHAYLEGKNKVKNSSIYMRLRLIDVKVRLAKNFSVFGGFGFGGDGYLSAGLNYKITGHEE